MWNILPIRQPHIRGHKDNLPTEGKLKYINKNYYNIARKTALSNLGCILLGLFLLFLFRFRNNRIHGISISKRTPLHVSDLETESDALECQRTWRPRRISPSKIFPKERVFCLFRVNRIPSILFILLSGAE